jgi:hypothetical protein
MGEQNLIHRVICVQAARLPEKELTTPRGLFFFSPGSNHAALAGYLVDSHCPRDELLNLDYSKLGETDKSFNKKKVKSGGRGVQEGGEWRRKKKKKKKKKKKNR